MKRFELVKKIRKRKEDLDITIENLSKLSGLGVQTINRLLRNEDVKLSTVESITNLLGLDFAGNEIISLEEIKRVRAKEKAKFLASLVQGTLSLEMQSAEDTTMEEIVSSYEKDLLHGKYKKALWVL